MGSSRLPRRGIRAALAATFAILLAPSLALAHPLGNFTINHYAGIRVGAEAVTLDVVIDMAEIPAFQERQRIDTDQDGQLSDQELEAERLAACPRLAKSLVLTVGSATLPLDAYAAGLTFPPGVGGLSTMRLVCEYRAALGGPLVSGTSVQFEDRSWAERIGWREIVAQGDGATIGSNELPTSSITGRLTSYPKDLLSQPLDVRSASFEASPGGPVLPPLTVPDARPLAGSAEAAAGGGPGGQAGASVGSGASSGTAGTAAAFGVPASAFGVVPGGVPDEINQVLQVKNLSPLALIGSLLIALGLGAIHAVSPGHGKTIMAAYLVGSRGSARHAVALGMTVTVSHTLGVLALAAVTLYASTLVPPERLYPILSVASGGLVILIGVWLLYGRYRAWQNARAHAVALAEHAHEHAHDHGHATDAHEHAAEAHGHGPGAEQHAAGAHDHGHTAEAHEHAAEPHDHHAHQHDDATDAHAHPHASDQPSAFGEHSHGGIRHSHLPAAGTTLTWRSLFALGLAGGLVPSASALLLLLGSLAANRPAYGLVLVVAFGVGMAIVLGGIGLALVYAARTVEHLPSGQRLRRVWAALPVATAVVVVAAGVFITSQAVHQVF